MFKCHCCKKEVLLLYYLSEYGRRRADTKDDNEHCKKCFEIKFEEKHNDKNEQE